MRANLLRVCACFLAVFVLLFGFLAYWQVVAADRLNAHPRNRRPVWLEFSGQRGSLVDRSGQVIARSEVGKGPRGRTYSAPQATAHLLGYFSERYGRAGLEGALDSELSPHSEPRTLRDLADELLGEARRGNDVVLTLDLNLQRVAWQALSRTAKPGAAVALDPRTGAILALASVPGYDPSTVDDDWRTLNSSATKPLLNRATQGLYPPGSTFKVVTASAAIENQLAAPNAGYRCSGTVNVDHYTISCPSRRAHGSETLTTALVNSCNCVFGPLAVMVGADKFASMARGFGLDSKFDLPVPSERSRLLAGSDRLNKTLLAQTGFGQGELAVTPLQMSVIAATVASGGVRMKPYLVKAVKSPEGTVLGKTQPEVALQVMSGDTAKRIGEMMRAVVAHGSTRRLFAGLGATVAGKTGSAENPHGQSHAWFICFAPVESPAIALAVVVENSGAGSKVAAPIAAQMLRESLNR